MSNQIQLCLTDSKKYYNTEHFSIPRNHHTSDKILSDQEENGFENTHQYNSEAGLNQRYFIKNNNRKGTAKPNIIKLNIPVDVLETFHVNYDTTSLHSMPIHITNEPIMRIENIPAHYTNWKQRSDQQGIHCRAWMESSSACLPFNNIRH